MMEGRLTYWKCNVCHGTGRKFEHWMDRSEICFKCDGTGNALVDGEERRLRRKLEEEQERDIAESRHGRGR